jgi:hypothetical protein
MSCLLPIAEAESLHRRGTNFLRCILRIPMSAAVGENRRRLIKHARLQGAGRSSQESPSARSPRQRNGLKPCPRRTPSLFLVEGSDGNTRRAPTLQAQDYPPLECGRRSAFLRIRSLRCAHPHLFSTSAWRAGHLSAKKNSRVGIACSITCRSDHRYLEGGGRPG